MSWMECKDSHWWNSLHRVNATPSGSWSLQRWSIRADNDDRHHLDRPECPPPSTSAISLLTATTTAIAVSRQRCRMPSDAACCLCILTERGGGGNPIQFNDNDIPLKKKTHQREFHSAGKVFNKVIIRPLVFYIMRHSIPNLKKIKKYKKKITLKPRVSSLYRD